MKWGERKMTLLGLPSLRWVGCVTELALLSNVEHFQLDINYLTSSIP